MVALLKFRNVISCPHWKVWFQIKSCCLFDMISGRVYPSLMWQLLCLSYHSLEFVPPSVVLSVTRLQIDKLTELFTQLSTFCSDQEILVCFIFVICIRDQSRYVPNQWESSLHCNDVSHWLSAYLNWSCCIEISSFMMWFLRAIWIISWTADHKIMLTYLCCHHWFLLEIINVFVMALNLLITQMWALLQLHIYSRLNTWLQ